MHVGRATSPYRLFPLGWALTMLVVVAALGACGSSSSNMEGLLNDLCAQGEAWQTDHDSGASTNQVAADEASFRSTLKKVAAIVDDTRLSAETKEAWGRLDSIGFVFVWGSADIGRECRSFQAAWSAQFP